MAPQGLTTAAATRLFAQQGPNELLKRHSNIFFTFLKMLISPSSLMLVAASLLSFYIGQRFDGFFIVALLVLNVGMTLWHTQKADHSLEALQSKLSVETNVMRDGVWRHILSRELVIGDVIACGVGVLVTADTRIDSVTNLTINEAVLTGESLPKEKEIGDTAYSGSVVATGNFIGTVIATGNAAFFGKIVSSGKNKRRKSSMERDIFSISRFLIVISLVAIVVLTTVFISDGQSLVSILLLDLSLLIAGIPVSLPTVMTVIVSIGALAVAARKALVRRLSSLEDLANVTLLLTDKTGTLTENKITIERVHSYVPFSEHEVRRYAAAAAIGGSSIDKAIAGAVTVGGGALSPTVIQSVPADSLRKHSTTLLEDPSGRYVVSIGTPPVIAGLCIPDAETMRAIQKNTEDAAGDGSRAVAISIKKNPVGIGDESNMSFMGMLVLADPLRAEAAATLRFLKNEGVTAVMVTGDTRETATHVTNALGLTGEILRPGDIDIEHVPENIFATTAAFAEVLPQDKLSLVAQAQRQYVVAVTGDGVNDLPAVHHADVGIAVENAVDALKGTADIVLLDSDISVIQTALLEARKVFFRLYHYSVYRISESLRLIIIALVLGILIKEFPLTPIQILLLAFLNDIPIITLAFDRVKRADRPADLLPRERFVLGTLFGLVGVGSSLCFYFFLVTVVHLPLALLQTAFFLKLTVSGHMLIYIAHTKERWWKFLPADSIIWATSLTQIAATALAVFGFFVAAIPLSLALFVWVWSFLWMQVGEWVKMAVVKSSFQKKEIVRFS